MPAQMNTPGINIVRTATGYAVRSLRPPAGAALCRIPLADAVRQTPNLLPVCGLAQRFAAERAVDEALGLAIDDDREQQRDIGTWLEQLRASIWRFAVDWPRLIGAERDLESVRIAMRSSEAGALKSLLKKQLEGLDATTDRAALADWVDGSGSVAAGVIRAARAAEDDTSEGADCLRPACRSVQWVFDALSGSDPVIRDHEFRPVESAEVGVRAMARHPLIAELDASDGELGLRLLAQVLDAAFLTRSSVDTAEPAVEWRSLSKSGIRGDPDLRMGIGLAITARGPLMHRVTLNTKQTDRAVDWEVIAPTDWHFARKGPVESGLAAGRPSPEWAELYCAGFDPCAEWVVAAGPAD